MASPSRPSSAGSGSRGRGALLLAIAAAIAVCALALLLRGDADVAVEDSASNSATEPLAAAADAGVSRDDAQRARAVDATDTNANAAVAADGALAAAKRTRNHVRIRVLDGTTKQPVEGAEVTADPAEDALEREQWGHQLSSTSRLRANRMFGQNQTTDADGCAWMRLPPAAQVFARKDALVAFCAFDVETMKPEGIELLLLPSRAASVVVVGADGGLKEGVPIGMWASYARGEMSDDEDEWSLGQTGPDGRVVVELGEFLPPGSPPTKLEFFVRSPGLVSARAAVVHHGEATLRLPAHGSLRVRAFGIDGTPLPDSPPWVVGAYTESRGEAVGGSATTTSAGFGGGATLPYVGLGQSIHVYLATSGYYLKAEIPGPSSANQQVGHEFSLKTPAGCSIRARLLDAEGNPLANCRVTFMAQEGWAIHALRTDEDGRVLARHRGDDDEPQPIHGRFRASQGDKSFFVFDPVTVAPGRENDFGDLRARAVDVVATGKLVCDEPLGPGISAYVRSHNGKDWQYQGDFLVHMMEDEDSFVVLDAVGGRNLRMQLSMSAPGFIEPKPIEFARGAELTVRLQRGPRFEARVLVDSGVSWLVERTGLDLVARNADGEGKLINGRLLDGQWVFASTDLQPGLYTLSIESGSASDDLAQMDSVRIGVGEPMDPRLSPWDLRSTIRVMTIRVRSEDNKLLGSWGSAYRRSIGDGSWESCASFENGIAQFLTTATALDLFVDFEDHGFARRSGVIGDLDLVLPPLQTVVVRVDGMPVLRENAPLAIHANVPEDWAKQNGLPHWTDPVSESSWDRRERTLTVKLSQPCAFRVDFMREQNGEWASVALVPCVVAAGQKELRIQAPGEVIAAAQPFVDPDAQPDPAPSNGGR